MSVEIASNTFYLRTSVDITLDEELHLLTFDQMIQVDSFVS